MLSIERSCLWVLGVCKDLQEMLEIIGARITWVEASSWSPLASKTDNMKKGLIKGAGSLLYWNPPNTIRYMTSTKAYFGSGQ